jgi:starch-binding outer membrane protein, SusD/RagB family
MVMKLNSFFILIYVVIFFFASCDGFLEENPKGHLFPTEILSTAQMAESSVNSLYGVLTQEFRGTLSNVATHGVTPAAQRYASYLKDVPGEDIWVSNTGNVARTSIDMFTHSHEGNDNIDRMYYSYYRGIKDCNFVILGLKNADFSNDPIFRGDIEAATRFKNQCMGQALGIRSYLYFDLVRLFGDVAVVPEELVIGDDLIISRKPMPLVYRDVIISDLNKAIELLGDMPSHSGAISRVTADACRAMLAEVYLTIAGRVYDKGISEAFISEVLNTKSDFYNECVRLCEALENKYSLYPNFRKLFTVEGNFSNEAVWEVQVTRNLFPMEGSPSKINDNFAGLFPFVSATGSIQTVDGWGRYSMARVLYEMYDKEYDTRLENVVEVSNTFNADTNPIQTWRSLKYADSTIINRQRYDLSDSNVAWKLIRYAHVLLMRAEALNELGRTNEATLFLDEVRKRAYRGNVDKIPSAPYDQSEFREFVWKERRKEFFGECYRYFDMQRTNTLHYAATQPAGSKNDIYPIVLEKHYLFPIPQIAFEYNPQLGTQNSGWN